MSESKHTPGPYRVGALIKEGAIRIETYGDGPHIGVMRFSDNPLLTQERAIANALFVVRACNAHDDLLAACTACELEMSNAYRKGLVDSLAPKGEASSFTQAVAVARAAIAKARGE